MNLLKTPDNEMVESTCGNCGATVEMKAGHIKANKALGRDWFCEDCK